MSITQSGIFAHDLACNAAESVRQSACAAPATQAAVITAEIVFYRACLASANARGLNPAPFTRALQDLGTGGI